MVQKRDGVIPLFVLQRFSESYPGLPGLFIACLFSGALSTLDSALHALATVTWEEIKCFNRLSGISDRNQTIILRLLSVFYGIIATGLAFLCNNLGSILVPFVNLKGSCFGLIAGQIINMWFSMGSLIYGIKTPTLEISATNCSMFNMTEIPME